MASGKRHSQSSLAVDVSSSSMQQTADDISGDCGGFNPQLPSRSSIGMMCPCHRRKRRRACRSCVGWWCISLCCYHYYCSMTKKVSTAFIKTTMAVHTSVPKYDSAAHSHGRRQRRQKYLLQPSASPTPTTTAADSTTPKSIKDKKIKTKKKKKRGTRTTGVGASTSAIFNAYKFDSFSENEHPGADDDEDVDDISNPMLGKLWVQASTPSSSTSSLIFKVYPSSNNNRLGDNTTGAETSTAMYIELSEVPTKENGRASKRRGKELHIRYITKYDDVSVNDPTLRRQSSPSDPSSRTFKFIPIEGIYGIYHLPHSGPHIVLITESERVYKSPSITLPSSADDVPLLELRKITCLEIISLRDDANKQDVMVDNEVDAEARISTTTPSISMMKEEEARQLRLLRKSFAEHDLYFTVPSHYYHHHNSQRKRRNRLNKSAIEYELGDNCTDVVNNAIDGAITVPDVTHTLQRSFMYIHSRRQHPSATNTPIGQRVDRWWTHYITATGDVPSTDTAIAIKKEEVDEDEVGVEDEDSDDSFGGFQQQQQHWRTSPRIAKQMGIDPRFFWNELPALSLMLASRRPHSCDDDDPMAASEKATSSLYTQLLDHLIPVTSAFVGVRQNIPIPVTSSAVASSSSNFFANTVEAQQQQQEMYDQLLISRRSKYRAGTRFTRRGTDEDGNVANYAETEQICFIMSRTSDDLPIVNEDVARVCDDSNGDNNNESIDLATNTTKRNTTPEIPTTLREIYSHVQTRGSIPLHWSSPVMTVGTYRPRVYICVDPMMQARGLRDHLLGDLQRYSVSSLASASSSLMGVGGEDALGKKPKITMVNLIDKHGDQGRLGRAFDSVLSAVLDVYTEADDENENDDDRGSSHTSETAIQEDSDNNGDDVSYGTNVSADEDNMKTKHRQHSFLPLRGGLAPNSIKHIWYDFHAECKGGRYDRLSQLLEQVMPTLNDQGYFCAALSSTKPTANTTTSTPTWEVRSLQDGVVRTNCMDCLDRTNVVQSMFGRYMLYRQLHQRVGLSTSHNRRSHRRTLPLECVVGYKQRPLTLPWTEGEASHRYLWADNADAISRLYAGTPALKGDFTRTGKRTRRGALDDGLNSLQRYYLNNFIDADRQEGMDLLVGSVEFDVAMPISSMMSGDDEDSDGVGTIMDESSRLLVLQELEKRSSKRRGYDGTHARIKVKTGETFGSIDGSIRSADQWMSKDLRYHMKHEAHRSRSPLSAASREEHLDASTSSDFLLKVTSAAAGDDNALSENGGDAMYGQRSLSMMGDSPWWVVSSVKRDDDDKNRNRAVNAKDGKTMHGMGQRILGIASNRVIILSLILLCRAAPVRFAALILAIVAISGLSSSSAHDHEGDWTS